MIHQMIICVFKLMINIEILTLNDEAPIKITICLIVQQTVYDKTNSESPQFRFAPV